MTKPKGPADYYKHLRPPLYGKYPTNASVRGSCRTETRSRSPSPSPCDVTDDSLDLTKATGSYITYQEATCVANESLTVNEGLTLSKPRLAKTKSGPGGLNVVATPTGKSIAGHNQYLNGIDGLNDG